MSPIRVASKSARLAGALLGLGLVATSGGFARVDGRAEAEQTSREACLPGVLASMPERALPHLLGLSLAWLSAVEPERVRLNLGGLHLDALASLRAEGLAIALHLTGRAPVPAGALEALARRGRRLTQPPLPVTRWPSQSEAETRDRRPVDALVASLEAVHATLHALDVDHGQTLRPIEASAYSSLHDAAADASFAVSRCDLPAGAPTAPLLGEPETALKPLTHLHPEDASAIALPRPPLAIIVIPLPASTPRDPRAMTTLGEDIAAVVTLLSEEPASGLARAFLGGAVGAKAIRAFAYPARGVLTLHLELSPTADGRTPGRAELLGALMTVAPGRAELEGLARLSGLPVARVRAAALAAFDRARLDASAVRLVPATGAPPVPPLRLGPSERDLFVAASIALTCPAPSETRAPELRLQERFGLALPDWRAISREIASHHGLRAELSRAIEDRCDELSRLRAMVSAETFQSLYRAYACTTARIPDPEARYEAEVRLMAGHGLDRSVLAPLLAMADDDPERAAAIAAVETECPLEAPPARGQR